MGNKAVMQEARRFGIKNYPRFYALRDEDVDKVVDARARRGVTTPPHERREASLTRRGAAAASAARRRGRPAAARRRTASGRKWKFLMVKWNFS